MKKEEINGLVDCLTTRHPDVFLTCIQKYYSPLPEAFFEFKNFLEDWPLEINKPFIDYDSFLPEEIRPKKVKPKKREKVCFNEDVYDFLKINSHFINWKEFSRRGVIAWNQTLINEFKDKIYWGLNSEQLEYNFNRVGRT